MRIEYYADGRKRRLTVRRLSEYPQRAARPAAPDSGTSAQVPQVDGAAVLALLAAQPPAVRSRFSLLEEPAVLAVPAVAGETTVIPTETISLGGTRGSEVAWLRQRFGLDVVEEGSHGKVLLAAPGDAKEPVRLVSQAALAVFERGGVSSAQPNFVRVMPRIEPAREEAAIQWALDNPGDPGIVGADVAAEAAWTITRGSLEVRVAVLDEGVDTAHAFLKEAVVVERDFVEGLDTAAPDGNDAHGTACAGIIISRDDRLRGLAPGVALVACRIGRRARWRHGLAWIADDFKVADAIDWCWDTAGAAVLSNSWRGGPPSDLLIEAFNGARTKGRGGKGAVVVAAAGNAQRTRVDYPGSLPEILTVGASNQWDERKTRTSRDGETDWGSNAGKGLDLMAPGVKILTTDITGMPGNDPGDTHGGFRGTSAAAPFVAAAAALVLSVAPRLTESEVRDVLVSTTDSMGPTGWDPDVGHGRLNAFRALREARRR